MEKIILKSLINLSGKKVIFPFYHGVWNEAPDFVKYLYKPRNIIQFERDILEMLSVYKPLNLNELISIQCGENFDKDPSFFLSFDDGLSSCFHTVFPVLEKHGIKAAFFINPDFVDNQNLFYRYKVSLILDRIRKQNSLKYDRNKILYFTIHEVDQIDEIASGLNIDFAQFLEKEQPYMTSEQIRTLVDAGHYVGGHSMDHPNFKDISLNNQIAQCARSVEFVRKNFNLDYSLFAFPFHDFGVPKAFFSDQKQIDLFFTIGGLEKDEFPRVIRRLDMEKNSGSVLNYLTGKYLRFMAKNQLGKGEFRR